jgi:hypothetical protein
MSYLWTHVLVWTVDCKTRLAHEDVLYLLPIGKVYLAGRGTGKNRSCRSLLQSLVGSIVNTSDYDRIREGDTLPT